MLHLWLSFLCWVGWLQSNEFTAMKAGGLSVYRLLVPILSVTLVICGLFALFYNRVASPAFHEAYLLQNKVRPRRGRNIVFKGKGDRIFYLQRIDLDARKIQQLTIYEYNTEAELARVTFAKSAAWTPTEWQLTDGYIGTLKEEWRWVMKLSIHI